MKELIKRLGIGIIAMATFVILMLSKSCESVLFIELEEAGKLIVVNGALTNDSTVAIQVSRSRHILDNAGVHPLDQAVVRLYQGGNMIEQLSYAWNGFYLTDSFKPEIGTEYIIEVENAGYPSVSARCEIPDPVDIVSLDTMTYTQEFGDVYWSSSETMFQFDLTLKDPPGVDNYYLLNLKADRSRTEWRDTTVVIIDSLYYGDKWNYYPRDSTYTVGDIVRFIDDPSFGSEDIIVEAITKNGILFSDQLIDGKEYSFRGLMVGNEISSADSAVVDFRLHSISESYYKYLKSRQKHYESKDDYLAVPVIVYSNVESGTGFFGGFSSDVYTITTFIPEYQYDYWYNEY